MGRTSEWISSKRVAYAGEEIEEFGLCSCYVRISQFYLLLQSASRSIIGLAVNYLLSSECQWWIRMHHQHLFIHFHRKSIHILIDFGMGTDMKYLSSAHFVKSLESEWILTVMRSAQTIIIHCVVVCVTRATI